MAKLTFVTALGKVTTVDATAGETLMRIALDNGVIGIEAECSGSLNCGTCHVYVAPQFLDWCSPRSETEEELLAIAASELRDNSRLSCQIVMRPEMDGMVVHLPESQF